MKRAAEHERAMALLDDTGSPDTEARLGDPPAAARRDHRPWQERNSIDFELSERDTERGGGRPDLPAVPALPAKPQ